MTAAAWTGVVPAMITPLRDGGRRVDQDALGGYCEFLASSGVHGVFCCGTTGEGPLLSLEERKTVAEAVVGALRGRMKVVVQTGAITTSRTIELTAHACEIGADAAGIVLPYYYGYSDDQLFSYFREIADSAPGFPLFVYNIPQCTTNNVSPRLFGKLLDGVDTIVGIKNSNPDILQTAEFLKIARGRCAVFMGSDSLLLAGLSAGVSGFVSGNAAAYPEPFVTMYEAARRNDLSLMRSQQELIDRLIRVLAHGRDIPSFKKALELRGVPAGSVRAPNRDLSGSESDELRKGLAGLGLLNHT